MRHLIIIAAIALLLSVAAAAPGSSAAPHGPTPTPTPSDHIVLGTPTAAPALAPALLVVWLRPGLARASWLGTACLHRYRTTGVHTFIGCAAGTLDTPAEMGDTFRVVSGAAAVSARTGVLGVVLLPIVGGG